MLFFAALLSSYKPKKIVFPMVLASGLTSLLHLLLCWAFILQLELGIKGSAIAICISNWFNTIILALYIKFSPSCKATWTGFSMESCITSQNLSDLLFPQHSWCGMILFSEPQLSFLEYNNFHCNQHS